MPAAMPTYRAILSSDWNECLAPCGPFDFIAFSYPELNAPLQAIFRQYTANQIPLSAAARKIAAMLPAPVSADRMDAYLQRHFSTYRGVPELMRWCADNRVLFMINTTGAIGYFQRVRAAGLLPPIPVLSAHPLVHYPRAGGDPDWILELTETTDKAANTARVLQVAGIPPDRLIVMGDSGGDGPHFEWGAANRATLIGSMTKASLDAYCDAADIPISLRFGLSYGSGAVRNPGQEMQFDFMELVSVIETVAAG
jgi:hypothetical protein